jgi:hypothetical protein
VVASVAYVGVRLGAWDGYLQVQRKWGSTVDWGATVMGGISRNLTDWRTVPFSVSVVLLLASVVLLVILMVMRPPLPVVVFAAAALALIIVQSNFLASRERFLLVVIPLLALLRAARVRTARRWPS